MAKVEEFRNLVGEVKEILKNPFDTKDLELKLKKMYALMKNMSKEELLEVKRDYEEVKTLLSRNLEIIAGGVKPFLKLERGVISRRV